MFTRGRVVIGSGVLVAATAFAVTASRVAGPDVANVEIVRIALGVCAIFYGGIALVYTLDGYSMQAVGHTLAGAGFAIVAVGGQGTVAWVGIGLLGTGGATLLSDALQQGGQGRAAT